MTRRVYADTSALAKLFLAERETPDLRSWFAGQRPQLLSSALLGVELIRLLEMVNPATVPAAESFLASATDIVEITPSILDAATHVPPQRLRTLDAIHLATALDVSDVVDTMLTYDKVLADAARAANLTVVSPGAAA